MRGRFAILIAAGIAVVASCDAETTTDETTSTGEEPLLCNPGETRSCYEGPDGTESVGSCAAGVEACLQHGRGWGPCVGQVLPQQENCDEGADENCDGLTSCGQTVWAQRLGGESNEIGYRMATDAAGNIYVVGLYRQPIDFGVGELPTSNGSLDTVIMKLDPDGEVLWNVGIFGNGTVQARDIAVSPDGEHVVVTAHAAADVELDDVTLPALGSDDLLLVKLDGEGQVLWSDRLGNEDSQVPTSVAVDDTGHIAVAGTFAGELDFRSGEPLVSAGFGNDIFVAKLDPDGEALWTRGYNAPLDQAARSVAFGPEGRVAVTGRFFGRVDFGGGELEATGETNDIFVVMFDEDGDHVFSRSWGGDGDDQGWALAIDSRGFTTITGRFEETVRFGPNLIDAVGAGAIFVTQVDESGNDLWTTRIGGSSEQFGTDLTLDSLDRVIVTGYYEGDVRFGEAKLPLSGLKEPNLLVAKLEPDGGYVWARGIAVDGEQDVGGVPRGWRSVSILPGDFIALGGFVQRAFDMGDGPLEDFGGADLLVAKLAP